VSDNVEKRFEPDLHTYIINNTYLYKFCTALNSADKIKKKKK